MIHQRTRLEDDKSSTNTAGMRGKSKRLENGKEQKKKKTQKKKKKKKKKPQKKNHEKCKIGRLANNNWKKGKLKLFIE